jgi:hypothetical protein
MGLFSWLGSRKSAGKPDRLRRWVMPTQPVEPGADEMKRAAAADIAEMEEDRRHVRPDAPGNYQDEL